MSYDRYSLDRAASSPVHSRSDPNALAIVGVYVGNGVSPWMSVGAILAIALVGAAYIWKRDYRNAVFALLCVTMFLPSLANLHALVPILGAVLLPIYSWRRSPRSRRFNITPQILPISCTVIVVLGAIAFQAVSTISSESGAFEWRALPGAEYGVVVSVIVVLCVSAVNACFEELLWRVELADLFRPRTLAVAQWVFVSVCFGTTHLLGTPGGLIGIVFAAVFWIYHVRHSGAIQWFGGLGAHCTLPGRRYSPWRSVWSLRLVASSHN